MATFRSATQVVLEEALPAVSAQITIVHGDADRLSLHEYALFLANTSGASLVLLPDAPHSWPVGDPPRFVAFVADLTKSVT